MDEMVVEPETFGVVVERDAPAAMRDGTVLRADIYRPADAGRFPVLVARTAYDKNRPGDVAIAEALAASGYVVVVQDIRGRNASDGDWDWIYSLSSQDVESRDGYDTTQWAASLPYADGQVGTWGNSYLAHCAWRTAAAAPPALSAVFVSGMPEQLQHQNFGSFETRTRLEWTNAMLPDALRRSGSEAGPRTREDAALRWSLEGGKWLWRLPLDSLPSEVFGPLDAAYKASLRAATVDPWAYQAIHPTITAPVCQLTGWWDIEGGNIENYVGLVAEGPEHLRDQHRLVVGPWGHNIGNLSGRLGPVDYGPAADLQYADVVRRWYDWRLKGIDDGIAGEPPIRLFVCNENRWRLERTWPVPGMQPTEFFLHGGSANTVRGDGALSRTEPAAQPPDRFVYDPRDPVMSLTALGGHAADQAPLDDRRDVLVYQSAPLDDDLLLIGPVECRLWVASDAPDTDFTAKLVEVRPDGLAINLSYGLLRTRYRHGYDREVWLDPDQPEEIRIVMRPIGIRFTKGSRLRLDVSSSDFPLLDRNHNTGKPFWSDAELRPARQTVFHDPDHPSRIVLPVVDDRGPRSATTEG